MRGSHSKKRIMVHETPNGSINMEVLFPDPLKGLLWLSWVCIPYIGQKTALGKDTILWNMQMVNQIHKTLERLLRETLVLIRSLRRGDGQRTDNCKDWEVWKKWWGLISGPSMIPCSTIYKLLYQVALISFCLASELCLIEKVKVKLKLEKETQTERKREIDTKTERLVLKIKDLIDGIVSLGFMTQSTRQWLSEDPQT